MPSEPTLIERLRMKDADGLDIIEALVCDAAAKEGVCNVHEGGSYYAERVIRRAVEQGTLIVVGPANHPAHTADALERTLTPVPDAGLVERTALALNDVLHGFVEHDDLVLAQNLLETAGITSTIVALTNELERRDRNEIRNCLNTGPCSRMDPTPTQDAVSLGGGNG